MKLLFKPLGPLNKKESYYVAFSGGKDSVAFTHYLLSRGFNITLLHFNHNLSQEDYNAYEFTKAFAKTYQLELIVDILNKPRSKKESPEEYQRKYRYNFLDKFTDKPIIMCHNLNDVLETWVFSSLKSGQSKLIPYSYRNIIRPFLLNDVETISNYLVAHNLNFYEDKTNNDLNIPRNYIRHVMMEQVLVLNIGFKNMLKRKILSKYKKEYQNVTVTI